MTEFFKTLSTEAQVTILLICGVIIGGLFKFIWAVWLKPLIDKLNKVGIDKKTESGKEIKEILTYTKQTAKDVQDMAVDVATVKTELETQKKNQEKTDCEVAEIRKDVTKLQVSDARQQEYIDLQKADKNDTGN